MGNVWTAGKCARAAPSGGDAGERRFGCGVFAVLVPDTQETVPRARAHSHAVLGHSQAADPVIVAC